jgi:hypothetical protein
MAIIKSLLSSVRLPYRYNGSNSPNIVASKEAQAHVTFNTPMRKIVGDHTIPVPTPGYGVCRGILLGEYAMFERFTGIAMTINAVYNAFCAVHVKAEAQREAALEKLFNDSVAAQERDIARKLDIELRLAAIPGESSELLYLQKQEKAKYDATLLKYTTRAQEANAAGNKQEADEWAYLIRSTDEWLVEILQIGVQIVDLKIEGFELEQELKGVSKNAAAFLTKRWPELEALADDLGVPVPYFPDLPERPILPPPEPDDDVQESFTMAGCMPHQMIRSTAMWLVSPIILPLGIPLRAALECIRHMWAPLVPKTAENREEIADLFIPNCDPSII